MKKSLLLLIPSLFLVTSCGDAIPDEQAQVDQSTCNHVDKDFDMICDKCGFDLSSEDGGDDNQHAITIDADPTAPFYLKLGEERKLQAKPNPNPTNPDEREMKWTNYSSKIASLTVDESDSRYAYVKGLSEGEDTIIATNKDNSLLTRTFNATVIDFDEENDYLWQYSSEDRAQFGYDSQVNKQGLPSGTAVLGTLSWDFTRSEVTSLHTSDGGLGFGKGKEPETKVHLQNENFRSVKEMTLEVASAEGLANMTVKIGDTVVIDNRAVPKAKDKALTKIKTESDLFLTGDISIDFETPAYDPIAQEQDYDHYKEPGAVVLKSILIRYAEEIEPEYVTTSTVDFESMVGNEESDVWKTLISSSTKTVEYAQDNIKYSLQKVKKVTSTKEEDAEKVKYINSNGFIDIFAPEGEVLSKVEFKYKNFTKNSVIYSGNGSIVGGAPYSKILGKGVAENCSFRIYQTNINSVRISSSSTSYIGLISLTVKTTLGTHEEIDSVKFAEGAMPTKLNYVVGDTFAPEGLGSAVATLKNTTNTVEIPLNCFNFYDGASYDANKDTATETLTADSTHVYAVYQGFSIKIEGILVGEIESIHFANGATPAKVNYVVGESFDPTGLGDAIGVIKEGLVPDVSIPLESINFYDGVSYDTDKTKATDVLTAKSTYVYAVYQGHECKIEGIVIGEIESIHFANGATPTKVNYVAGEQFDPTGLGDAIGVIKDGLVPDFTIPLQSIKFYDGSSYDENKQTATNILTGESTYVYAVYQGLECKVEGITVQDTKVNYSKVKSLSEIGDEGTFLFVVESTKSYWKGSSSSGTIMKGTDGVGTLKVDAFSDTISLSNTLIKDEIKITKTNDEKYRISTASLKIGLTASNGFSVAAAPEYQDWEISINDGVVQFKITGNSSKSGNVQYLGFNSSGLKFNIYAKAHTEISLYKLVK